MQVDRSFHECLSGCVNEPENICLEASNTERNHRVSTVTVVKETEDMFRFVTKYKDGAPPLNVSFYSIEF